jgi:crotonobetaine/carnitine-CoA ligase
VTTWETAAGLTTIDVLRQRANAEPDRRFCRFSDGRWRTYGELWEGACAFGAALLAGGVKPGDRVAVQMSRRFEYLQTMLGVFVAGATYVPFNAEYAAQDIAMLLRDCTPGYLVTDAVFAPTVLAADAIVRGEGGAALSITSVDGPADGMTSLADIEVDGASDEQLSRTDDLAVIMYTSGTTGKPKGVGFSHGNLMFVALEQSCDRHGPNDRGLNIFPFHHFNGGLSQLIPPIVHGAQVVVADAFDPVDFGRRLREDGITTLNVNSNHVYDLLAQPESPHDADHGCRRMSLGLKLDAATHEAFERRFNTTLQGAYGLTEAVGPFILGRPHFRSPRLSQGRPVPGYEVAIIDEAGERLGPGEPGEVIVRPTAKYAFFAGYWNDPERTNALLQNGWIHTGDLGYFDTEGSFFYLQRVVDQVRRNGKLVAPCLAEDVILEVDAVREVVVVGLANDGQNEMLCAMLTLRDPGLDAAGVERVRAAVRDICVQGLPPELVPDHIIQLPALPKDVLGKIDKKRLRQDTLAQIAAPDTRERPAGTLL